MMSDTSQTAGLRLPSKYGIPLFAAVILLDQSLFYSIAKAMTAYAKAMDAGEDADQDEARFQAAAQELHQLGRKAAELSALHLSSGVWLATGLRDGTFQPIVTGAWRHVGTDWTVEKWLRNELTLAGTKYYDIHVQPVYALSLTEASVAFGYLPDVMKYLESQHSSSVVESEVKLTNLKTELVKLVYGGIFDAGGFDPGLGSRRILTPEDLEKRPKISKDDIELGNGTLIRNVRVSFRDQAERKVDIPEGKNEDEASSEVETPAVILSAAPSKSKNKEEGPIELRNRGGAPLRHPVLSLAKRIIFLASTGSFTSNSDFSKKSLKEWFRRIDLIDFNDSQFSKWCSDLIPDSPSEIGRFASRPDDETVQPGRIINKLRWPFLKEMAGLAWAKSLPDKSWDPTSNPELADHMIAFCVHKLKFRPSEDEAIAFIRESLPSKRVDRDIPSPALSKPSR